jgi:mannose-6-phosphate isomerase
MAHHPLGGPMLYPLKFHPIYKDYLWGGRRLAEFGRTLPEGPVAESWELSAHPDGVSVIANGPLAGMAFPQYLKEIGEAAIGSELPLYYATEFPLLIKLIDAREQLSVQVHPDDEYARKNECGCGKCELWHVLQAEPGAEIVHGLQPGVNRDMLAAALQKGELDTCLRKLSVKAGDNIFIPAGTVHALGGGILLAEVQQSSNLTYRLYDYDRVDAKGEKRPLHIEQALEVIDYEGKCASVPPFTVEETELTEEMALETGGDRFTVCLFLAGTGEIVYSGGRLPVQALETVFIPAGLKPYTIRGRLKYLKIYCRE